MNSPKTPECDKLHVYRSSKLVIDDFIDWLKDNDYLICKDFEYEIQTVSTKNLVMDFLEIDQVKLEEERRALLDYQHSLNEKE